MPRQTAQVRWQPGVNIAIDDNPELARVSAVQQLLFPANPRVVCEQIGLNWWAALKLYEDGWLSYSPATLSRLDEAQEAELRFVVGDGHQLQRPHGLGPDIGRQHGHERPGQRP